jgi:hypothetical protein
MGCPYQVVKITAPYWTYVAEHTCTDPIDLIFYRERASQPAKNETKEK